MDIVCENLANRMPVSGVNAHLRLFPRDQSAFRVVLTLHHQDASLFEAELSYSQAADLLNEITGVMERGIEAVLAAEPQTEGADDQSRGEHLVPMQSADSPGFTGAPSAIPRPDGNPPTSMAAGDRFHRPKLSLRFG